MMGFTSMLAAAILTVDTVFLAFFFIFLGLAVSTFVALEMWRSAQGTVTRPLEAGTAAADHMHNALGITSAGIALAALDHGRDHLSVLPRFSGGYMSGAEYAADDDFRLQRRRGTGRNRRNQEEQLVVMRVTVDGGHEAAHGVHWRGVALTKFDGKRWFNEAARADDADRAAEGGWFQSGSERQSNAANSASQSITPCCSNPSAAMHYFLLTKLKMSAGILAMIPAAAFQASGIRIF